MKTLESEPISYCVYSSDCSDIRKKILAWIAARESEGWIVEMQIKEDDGRPAVMWQCVKHVDPVKNYAEFTACIGMCGREFYMN